MSEDLQKIKSLIVLTSAYYQHPIANEVVQMYAEDLADLGFEGVKAALLELRKDPGITRFPLDLPRKNGHAAHAAREASNWIGVLYPIEE
jgi:hypothetical protein